MTCRFCSEGHADPTETCPWDWHGIGLAEARAKRKARTKPPCRTCSKPMWFDQPGHHYVCKGEGDDAHHRPPTSYP